MTRLTRRYIIRALHNLKNPDLSDMENSTLYGLCYRLHGHDYHVDVTVEAPIDSRTGLVVHRDELERVVNEVLVQKYDGHFLNESFVNTSGEALSRLFYMKLKQAFSQAHTQLGGAQLVQVSIQETRKNWFAHSEELSLMSPDPNKSVY
jgi:6-pyruvoyltetrahydropterin/6-carboxytetrahydropterin synthase